MCGSIPTIEKVGKKTQTYCPDPDQDPESVFDNPVSWIQIRIKIWQIHITGLNHPPRGIFSPIDFKFTKLQQKSLKIFACCTHHLIVIYILWGKNMNQERGGGGLSISYLICTPDSILLEMLRKSVDCFPGYPPPTNHQIFSIIYIYTHECLG